MNRIIAAALTALALSACTTYGEGPDASEPPVAGEDACGASALQDYVGLEGNPDNRADLEAAAEDGFRWIPHGTAVTMDYRPYRLNVELNEDGVITRIACY